MTNLQWGGKREVDFKSGMLLVYLPVNQKEFSRTTV